MSRLVVVSNRVHKPGLSNVAAGGLAVGLQAALEDNGGLWFGWDGTTCETEPRVAEIDKRGEITFATIELNKDDFELYYNGFSNASLWPVFHYLLAYYKYDPAAFEAYWRVNSLFARRLLPLLEPDDIIWVHDYHLIPLVSELREAGIDNPIGFFLHVPFPDFDMLRVLPVFRSLLRAMCLYDVVGFHTERDCENFINSVVDASVGAERLDKNTIRLQDNICRVDVYPIGIDVDTIGALAKGATDHSDVTDMVESLVGRDLIIGVDRLDYSKGLQERFQSYERLLEKYPTNRKAVIYMQIAPPTRTGVREYDAIRYELEQSAGHINGRFATPNWVPLRYLNTGIKRDQLMAVFRAARVGLVTPIRDGMNLVAKEYVASQDPADPGMLVLSRLAGAAAELQDAILVNPYDIDAVADGIEQALSMSLEERLARHASMMQILRTNDITAWRTRVVNDLLTAGEKNTAALKAAGG
jgi:trehalose 6-phosphate synthase